MADSKSASSGGVGFGGLLFLVFLVLKLTKVITWSWLWVTAPLWGGVALAVSVFLGIIGFAAVAALIGSVSERRRRPF